MASRIWIKEQSRSISESCSLPISEEQARSRCGKVFAKNRRRSVCRIRPTIGRTAIVGENKYTIRCLLMCPQVTYYRILRPEILDRRYLSYYFRSQEFRHIFEAMGRGRLNSRITRDHGTRRGYQYGFSRYRNANEHRRAYRCTSTTRLGLNRRMSATLEEMARALYRSWFVDFDPVHARAVGQAPRPHGPHHCRTSFFLTAFGPDGLPKGWVSLPLSSYAFSVKKVVKPMDAPASAFLHFSLPAFDAGRLPIHELGEAINKKQQGPMCRTNAILFSQPQSFHPSSRVGGAKTAGVDGIPAASTEFFVAAAHDPVEDAIGFICLLSSSDFLDEALSRATGTSNSHQRVPPKALAEIEG